MNAREAFQDDLMAAVDRLLGAVYPDLTEWDAQVVLRQLSQRYRKPQAIEHALAVEQVYGPGRVRGLGHLADEARRDGRHIAGVTSRAMIHALLTDGRTVLFDEDELIDATRDDPRTHGSFDFDLYARPARQLFTLPAVARFVRESYRGPWWHILTARRVPDFQTQKERQ